ncbi:TPA: OFA family MFS transporter [Streptococcus pyogenes]|uniref:Permease MFS superfamily n=1 Tax=Streptococcus pyogenes serotype M12 (strain MGAS9429) TaxID=370551 RepID=Q1JL50_STRPC|nr:OFA family MFS transporter [Streptococcus pyogenes]ABF36253.1 Permease MFS superfamily [Streptococcus pyogenes MGAS2096]EZM57656.1 oxalate/formate antiporter [Streptococcus pyogenes ABC020046230]HEP6152811.1 OFA family MFS transporter [Streptococcus pyogenes ABC020047615]HEP6175065.1 OFA family MFS transporter [Streptococcus pyogenes ABC020056755]HEP6180396.1 OFA family MFS transporter [Streptococcus pyogenes ABC020057019]HEP6183866.1 OFA family MFS transporter [Streptococcus pyogenes ABC0
MEKTKRYIIATAGILLHLMLGSTYAWSVYRNPILQETGWDQAPVAFAFSLAIFCLGLSAAFMGNLVEQYGPRLTGTVSAILYASGNMLTGLAIDRKEIWLLYIGYGVIGGLGLGAGYITPISTIIKWFPDKRGMATGFAIMGFGFASLLTSPIAQWLIETEGLVATFYLLGLIYLIVMLFASQLIIKPTAAEIAILDKKRLQNNSYLIEGMTAKEALKTKSFYCLWVILFINITCGLGLISVVAPMAQDLTGMSPEMSAIVVGAMGIFNGFGRLVWASLSDYIGRRVTVILLFLVSIIMTISLIFAHSSLIFMISIATLMTCYGAGFSLIPPYLSDLFGAKELATLHGYILTAWAIAALTGPMLLSITVEWTHNYLLTLCVFIVLYILGLMVVLRLKK